VLGPVAAARGLRLRLRYEHLASEVADDPQPWEPDPDELLAVGEELHTAVVAMHAEEAWAGVKDEAICATCAYRSICPDTAASGSPSWPAASEDAGEPAVPRDAAVPSAAAAPGPR
jgi:hypothetical protein